MREFLARKEVEHAFTDIRKAPLSRKATVALVRTHTRALAKKGPSIQELDPRTATDAEIEKLFLGREGTMRAPTVSNGTTIFAGFDEDTLDSLC